MNTEWWKKAKAVKTRRKRSSDEFAPGRAAPDVNGVGANMNSFEFADGGNINDRTFELAASKRRKQIRAARENRCVCGGQDVECIC